MPFWGNDSCPSISGWWELTNIKSFASIHFNLVCVNIELAKREGRWYQEMIKLPENVFLIKNLHEVRNDIHNIDYSCLSLQMPYKWHIGKHLWTIMLKAKISIKFTDRTKPRHRIVNNYIEIEIVRIIKKLKRAT